MNLIEIFIHTFIETTIIFLTTLIIFTYHTEIRNYLIRRGLIVPNPRPLVEHDVQPPRLETPRPLRRRAAIIFNQPVPEEAAPAKHLR